MSESTSKRLNEAFELFKDGYAVNAASILQKYAQQLSSEAEPENADIRAVQEKSDLIAALGIKLVIYGDVIELQKYAAKLESWKKKRKSFDVGLKKLSQSVQIFKVLYQRIVKIVHEEDHSHEWIRRIGGRNLLERYAHGFDQVLSAENERDYLLGRARQDIEELYQYAFELNHKLPNHIIGRRIREGEKHEHLAILLQLQASLPKYEELKSLQVKLKDFIQNSPDAPLRPTSLGGYSELFGEFSKLLEEEQANT